MSFQMFDSPHHPKFVHFETTNKCNLQCSMCGNSSMVREHRLLNWDVFYKSICEISSWTIKPSILLHTIGEPLLHPLCPDMVRMIHAKNLHLHFYTNGTIHKTEVLIEILSDPQSVVTISLGLLSELEKEHRGCQISRLMNAHNWATLPGKLVVRGIIDDYKNNIDKSWHSLIEKAGALLELTQEGNQAGQNPRTKIPPVTGYNRKCRLPFTSLVVYADGSLGYCVIDFEASLSMKNPKDETLLEFWNGSMMSSVRQNHKKSHLIGSICEYCSCRHHNWKQFNSIYVPEKTV
ncbi:MAG: hypothetical protein COA36_17600 [Desulfotalea sp.]|nr:MAG: hypothetical protein COA36_17600 [Desulfotalea sp.]